MDNRLAELLEEKDIRFDNSDGPSAWTSYVPMLVVTGAVRVLFIFFMMRRLGGAGSPMAFGRSRGKMYAQEDLGVTFDDVAGIDEAVDELREVVEFLTHARKISGARRPHSQGRAAGRPAGHRQDAAGQGDRRRGGRAVLQPVAVPTSSKCSSASAPPASATCSSRPRPRRPASSSSTSSTRWARPAASSIVGGHDEREQTLNALLVEMDGFDSNSGVIVMAATNRPETLDPALLRPGRFDRHVLVDRPDVRGREAILKVHVQNVKLDDDVEPEGSRRRSPPASSAPTWPTW